MSRAGATGASCTDGAVRGSSGRRKWLPTPLRKLSHNKLTATPSLSAGELPPVAGRPLPPKPPLKKTNSERKVQPLMTPLPPPSSIDDAGGGGGGAAALLSRSSGERRLCAGAPPVAGRSPFRSPPPTASPGQSTPRSSPRGEFICRELNQALLHILLPACRG
ncbi:hypothetical protein FJT64_012267 [Amphibalanus amphitrite]|uniref:Uncharacterized protein n=1 Tax=Amphibalanus amphitrite TaxID=1232801 RepID=A0A6A4VGP0_AMPAM|nr:hypothetical protein FJT64_012267 [Amphibalanus amphitrite]